MITTMADSTPTPPQNTPDPDAPQNTPDPNAPRPTGRPVYESSLLPPRRGRRFSPWLILPGLLLGLLGGYYVLVFGPKPRPNVVTAGTVVFASDENSPGVPHLWTRSADGSGAARQLTSGPAADSGPAFTADGRQIAFLSNRGGGANQVWLADGDGKNPVQVTRTTGAKAAPKFAPGSNTLLGFLSGASLAVLSVGRGDAALLLPPPKSSAQSASDTAPEAVSAVAFAWKPSPDKDPDTVGLAAVLESGGVQTLAVLPTLSSPPRLTQTDQPGSLPLAAADRLSPACAPGGDVIAAGLLHVLDPRLPPGQKISGLYKFDAAGAVTGPIIPPLPNPDVGPQNPVFSPDGALVVFEIWRQSDLARRTVLGLFVTAADGSGTPHVLAHGDAEAAQFAPDGKTVFFLARRADGGHDLMRIGTDGTGAARVSDGRADVSGFAVSPQAAAP